MRTLDTHGNAGAYALGVLDARDAFLFEDHLMECPRCSIQVSAFHDLRAQLDAYVQQTPPGVPLFVSADEGLWRRTLRGAEALVRRSRRRRLLLVAAAAVLAVGAPLAVLTTPGQADGQAVRWAGADRTTGTAAVAVATAHRWGTDVGLELTRVGDPGTCSLIAVGRDGTRETVTSWSVPYGSSRPLVTSGGAAMRIAQIDHFEVRTSDGRRLVTLGD